MLSSLWLSGCLAVSLAPQLNVTVRLNASGAYYPLENATVQVDRQSEATNSGGRAGFVGINNKAPYEVNVGTLFGSSAKSHVQVDGPTQLDVIVGLPESISDTLFRHAVFWKQDGANWRWPAGSELRIYLDYSSGPVIPDRKDVESYLMAEFRQWEQSGLVTMTQVDSAEDANVFVHFMTTEAWLRRFPYDAENVPAGRGGPRPGIDGYTSGGDIWFHSEGCVHHGGCHFAPGTAVHEMGHVLGLTHDGPILNDESTVMSYTFTDAVTPVDLTLLALKFSLPAHITASGEAAGGLQLLHATGGSGWTQP